MLYMAEMAVSVRIGVRKARDVNQSGTWRYTTMKRHLRWAAVTRREILGCYARYITNWTQNACTADSTWRNISSNRSSREHKKGLSSKMLKNWIWPSQIFRQPAGDEGVISVNSTRRAFTAKMSNRQTDSGDQPDRRYHSSTGRVINDSTVEITTAPAISSGARP